MIENFANQGTEVIFLGRETRVARHVLPIALHTIARRKLAILDYAADLPMLRIPPNNHLEALTGDRKGDHSIRINDKYRICFRWNNARPTDVEIVDYRR